MKTTPAAPLSASTGEQARARKRPRDVPAVRELAPTRRVPANSDWPGYLAALTRRGQLSLVFDPHVLSRLDRGTTRGRPYPTEMIVALCLLQAATGWSMRRVLGFAADQARLARRTLVLPDVATWCRRRRDGDVGGMLTELGQQAAAAVTHGPVVLLLDATGISLRRDGDWNRNRRGTGRADARRGRFVKIHAGVDEATGVVHALVVTGGDGRGSADAACGPELIAQASGHAELAAVIGDGAYDTRRCHTAAAAADTTMIAPIGDRATYGLHPARDVHLAQVGRLGPVVWKQRVGYHRRSLVESTFGALKGTLGHTSRATTRAGATAEVLARIVLFNRWAADTAASLRPLHPDALARVAARGLPA